MPTTPQVPSQSVSFVGLELFFAVDDSIHQGTLLFMSDASRAALQRSRYYLQSPVDDIESFSWVLLYSIVQNSMQIQHSSTDDLLPHTLDVSRAEARRQFDMVGPDMDMGYCLLTRTLSASGLLVKYDEANRSLRAQWAKDCNVLHAAEVYGGQVWELCSHAAAVGGLLAILRVVKGFKS